MDRELAEHGSSANRLTVSFRDLTLFGSYSDRQNIDPDNTADQGAISLFDRYGHQAPVQPLWRPPYCLASFAFQDNVMSF
jgi:hypothetical protein